MSELISAILQDKNARDKERVSQVAYATAVNTPPWSG